MKVYSAIMLDEDDVADHNAPKLLLADSAAVLLQQVQAHIKTHAHWLERVGVTAAELDALSIDEINANLVHENANEELMGMELYVYTETTEV